jgi:hypothetical protein
VTNRKQTNASHLSFDDAIESQMTKAIERRVRQLRALERRYHAAKAKGNYRLAAKILEQAARLCG